jgi:hypothetical protein
VIVVAYFGDIPPSVALTDILALSYMTLHNYFLTKHLSSAYPKSPEIGYI